MDTCPALYRILLLIPFACGFNLDTEHPKLFLHQENNTAFGYRVCHFGSRPRNSVLVTDPLRGSSTGGVFRCSYDNGRCEPIHVDVQPGSAFGLSLACSDHRAMVCGPHLVQECEGFNYLNGVCTEFNSDVTISHTIKPAFQECHVIPPLDAVILFDDSLSIVETDFKIMIEFIKNIIKAFIKDPRSQVGVAKFSTDASAIFQFENFASNRDADKLMSGVTHGKGQTHTPSAIHFVLENMFQEDVGMRNKSQKLLVVITDGKSNELKPLTPVIAQAQERGIIRFAIGVGSEYSRDELEEIASSPDYVFETKSFSALANILNQLTQRIFTIEGTNVGNSIQLELSQGGFSVALSEEASVFGAVGAYSWSGGLEEKRPLLNASFVNASNLQEDMTDSYLGYSVAMARVEGSVVYFSGAPRHKHIGTVLGFSRSQGNEDWTVTHRANGSQLGSYFGAELCVLDGLLAVGAPLYYSAVAGGEVTIYTLSTAFLNSSGVLRGAVSSTFGRFGSALAAIQDLNGDGLLELGVGAPQEEQGQGAVYIFLSKPGGIREKHSQRVCGSAVNEHLQYFGVSLHSSVDLSSDGLPDVVVGSKGAVTVLRTHPVLCVNMSVTLDPPIISQNVFHCSAPYGINTPVAKATVCVNMREDSRGTIQGSFRAAVSVTLELDSNSRPRLLFSPKSRISVWNTTVDTTSVCSTHSIILQNCISDYHDVPLHGTLRVEGETVDGTGGLKPVQNPDCPQTFTKLVILEKVCGEDHVCVSDLNVSLNSSEVVDIQDFPVNISVVVVNNGEDAADTELLLCHPSVFSFTRITAESDGHVGCVSNETGPTNITHTSCRLGVGMLRQGMKVHLTVLFRVSEPAVLGDHMTINASVTSKNEDPQRLHDNSAAVSVPVKQHVNFLLDNYGSTQFIRYDQNTLINHTYKVENLGELSVPVRVEFVLPLEISAGFLWDVSHSEDVSSGVKCERLKLKHSELKHESWHSQHSTCRLIGCSIRLTKGQPVIFRFSGHIKSRTKVDGAQVTVVSWGFVSFDRERYSQYNNEEALRHMIATEVEFPAQGRTILIASVSVFFGLVAVAVIFFVLYKVGFLKSKIAAQQGAGTVVSPGGGGGETPADCLTTETTPDEEIATQPTENDK